MTKVVLHQAEIGSAKDLANFLVQCGEIGADLEITNIENHTNIKGEEAGNAILIEESLSDGSTVHNIELHQ